MAVESNDRIAINQNQFIEEIAEQCRFLLKAVDELEQHHGRGRSLRRLTGLRFQELYDRFGLPPRSAEAEEFDHITKLIELQGMSVIEHVRWTRFHVDTIVNHAARIERLLWPTKKYEAKMPERAKRLRRVLRVDDRSSLRAGIRDLRNGWQHIDERMVDRQIDPPDPAADEDESRTSPTGLRVEGERLTVTAHDVTVELEPVINEVRVLLARCQLAAKTIDPLWATHYRMQLDF